MVDDFFNAIPNSFPYAGDSSESTHPRRALRRRGFGRGGGHDGDFSNRTGTTKTRRGESRGRVRGKSVSRPPAGEDRAELKRSERTVQVVRPKYITPRGFSRGGESRLAHSQWVNLWMLLVCMHVATTVGSSRWPWEAKRTRSPPMLSDDAMNDRKKNRGCYRKGAWGNHLPE